MRFKKRERPHIKANVNFVMDFKQTILSEISAFLGESSICTPKVLEKRR